MKTGLDHLVDSRLAPLRGLRLGLMTNPSAVTAELTSAYTVFRRAMAGGAVDLAALFAPEHGFAGAAPDGALLDSGVDARTGLPVYSLHGETFRPTAGMLRGLDVLLCDIQDIGVRYYTFTWTVTHILEACGAAGVRVVVLDRPDPLGGVSLEGTLIEPAQFSLVGRAPVPIVHGLTLGELARMFNELWNPNPADLTVIPCAGWSREMTWEQTGRPWVPPSPNMPHLSTLRHYPGACLIEGTNLSEGRGTPLPFEIAGAPWVDGEALAERLNAQAWPGVRFRPHTFEPSASKWAGETCGGVQAHLTDAPAFRPIHTWLGVIQTIRELYPAAFEWNVSHFDRLIGGAAVRQAIDAGEMLDAITAGWGSACRAFAQLRREFLLY